jgi:hypothetical protein
MRRSLLVSVALSLVLAAERAPAQPTGKETSEAAARFKSAQQLYDQRKFEQALPMFQDVDRVLGSPNSLLYAARCLRELGRRPEAYHMMSRAMQTATERASADPSYTSTRDAAAAERAAIETTVGRVVVAVVDPPAKLELRINDEPVDPKRIGDIIAVAPGSVRIDVSAPGRTSFRKNLTVTAGTSETIAVTLPVARAAPPAPTASPVIEAPPDAPEPEASGGTVRTLGFVTAGVGVLGMATFAVTGLMANATYSEIEEECGEPPCRDPSYTDRINTGMALDTVANVGLVVGIAGIVGGGLMILLGGPDAAPSAGSRTTPTLSLLASPRGGSMFYRLEY